MAELAEFESGVTPTLIALARPVDVERSTRCAPSVSVTLGLSDAELIADAMPESVFLLLSSVIVLDLLPTLMIMGRCRAGPSSRRRRTSAIVPTRHSSR